MLCELYGCHIKKVKGKSWADHVTKIILAIIGDTEVKRTPQSEDLPNCF